MMTVVWNSAQKYVRLAVKKVQIQMIRGKSVTRLVGKDFTNMAVAHAGTRKNPIHKIT